ncbi:hypothetical protein [Salibacterium aidingense]|uniref:hypothetical protein n=1 Tax=Salibacterium aidingense TaxID=384933 RepID=UPI00041B5FFD|nr:hypothetical protein [Salibacterium aidingense]
MKVYYEEIDGELQAKWVLVKTDGEQRGALRFYNVSQPIERFYEEDFADLAILSVDIGELVRDPFDDYVFAINTNMVQSRLESSGHDPAMLEEAEYFIMLVEDLEEVMSVGSSFFE